MIKRFFAIAICAVGMQAAPLLQLDPADGRLTGSPGETIGWGFSLSSDPTRYLTVIGSLLLNETNPLMGTYTDLIGAQGGPSGGILPPGDPNWVQSFDPLISSGAGSYSIDPFVPIGAVNIGTLRILFEVYSDDPTTCGSCFLFSDSVDAEIEVTVDAVPEPSTFGLLCGAGLLSATRFVAARTRRRRTASAR